GGLGFNPQFGWGLVNAAAAVGTPLASNYGNVRVTATAYTTMGLPVPGADVILWVGTPSCSGLTQVVQTTQTSSGPPGVGTAGVAVFNAVPAGDYCATAVLAVNAGKGATALPLVVTAGGTTSGTIVLLPVPPFSSDISGLYVANSGGGSGITVYALGASGNVAPVRTLPVTGITKIYVPDAVALDSAGYIYVNTYNSILVFPPGASGNWFPARTISGTSTGLSGTFGVALDSADYLFVANGNTNSILVFPPGASGNVAPARTIGGTNTGLNGPYGIALDSAGNLYVTNDNVSSITVYPPGATGNVSPARIISGGSTGLFQPSLIYLR